MSDEQITRQILWNVGPFTQVSMYVLAALATGVMIYGFWRRIRFWRLGTAAKSGQENGEAVTIDWRGAPGRLLRHVVAQVRIARIKPAWLSHMAIFYGFIVLFIGTVMVAVEHYILHFFYGRTYLVSSFFLDLFGVAFCLGLIIAIARRGGLTRVRPSSKPVDAAILWLLLIIGVTGFVVEGLRIAYDNPSFERVSFVGWGIAQGLDRIDLTGEAVRPWHLATWWVHMVLVMAFIAMLPFTKLMHLLVAPLYIAIAEPRNSGHLRGVRLEEVEETGRFGVEKAGDFSRRQLMSFDACTHCRRCEVACPAYNTDKPLSPMRVVHDVAQRGGDGASLHGETISAETLWSCTTCGACVYECPVLIDQLGSIIDMRRFLVGEGQVLGSSQAALRSIAATGNPWGLPQDERADWAEGMGVPTAEENTEIDILFWVGCAGSYDRRNQSVTRSLAKVLRAAGVDYAILGKKERCTGDPARRLGDEFTFMELAQNNVATLDKVRFRRVVTACAHCFNTLKNEYPDFGGNYEVLHHTELLQQLINEGRLPMQGADGQSPMTLHDPCYVARHNRTTQPARDVLGKLAGPSLPIVEPELSGEQTFCCGAGGGRMWMEEDIDKRVNIARFEQLKQTGAKTVATGCPYCMTMLDDASKNDEAAGIEVKDLAELVAERLDGAELHGA